MVGEITLRKATKRDSQLLLGWRNDEETRKQSLNTGVVKSDQHASWLDKITRSEDHLLLVAESDGSPVGALRLDKVAVEGEDLEFPNLRLVSYVVAPENRQKGYGLAILKEGCLSYGGEYGMVAQVKEGNVASIKILEACGFLRVGEVRGGVFAYLRNSTDAESQTIH